MLAIVIVQSLNEKVYEVVSRQRRSKKYRSDIRASAKIDDKYIISEHLLHDASISAFWLIRTIY